MARLPRLTLPGHLHHVVQRGNNRQPIFLGEDDHAQMLALLAEHASACGVAVHAYVLLTNEMQLLVTPASTEGLSRCMQAVGRRYVQAFNRRHGRSGTLWEGRYRSTVLEPALYLLPCMVAMDWCPVHAGLAAQPGDYAWSSHRHWTGLRHERLLSPHAEYWALGNTPFAREAAYAQRVQTGLNAGETAALQQGLGSGWPLGSPEFVARLQQLAPRRVVPGRAGRPVKNKAE